MAELSRFCPNASVSNTLSRKGTVDKPLMNGPEQVRLGRRVINNVLSNIGRGAVSFPLTLVVTPILVMKLGTAAFGTWALIQAFTSYVGLLDLGMGSAVAKFVAQYKARGRDTDVNEILSSAWVIHLGMAVLGSLAVFLGRDWIAGVFFKGTGNCGAQAEVSQLLAGAVVIFSFNLAFTVFPSLLIGLQRMDLSNLGAVAGILLNGVGSVVVVFLGWGLHGLLLISGLTTLLTVIITYLLARREYPELHLSVLSFRLSRAKSLLRLSLQYQVVALASLVHTQLDKLLLGYFLGVRFVAYYEIGGRLINQLRSVPNMFLSPILPAASQLDAVGNRQDIETLYRRGLRYVGAVVFAIFPLTAALAQPIVLMWIGPEYELTTSTLRVLSIANLVNLLTGPGANILAGVAKPRYAAYTSLLGIVLNIIMSPLLILRLGYKGAVMGTSLSLITASCVFIAIFHRIQHLPGSDLVRATWVPASAATVLGIIAWRLAPAIGGWVSFLIVAAAFGSLYVAGLLLFWLQSEDSQFVAYIRELIQRRRQA